jgi:hypothetical protein
LSSGIAEFELRLTSSAAEVPRNGARYPGLCGRRKADGNQQYFESNAHMSCRVTLEIRKALSNLSGFVQVGHTLNLVAKVDVLSDTIISPFIQRSTIVQRSETISYPNHHMVQLPFCLSGISAELVSPDSSASPSITARSSFI